MFMLVASDLRKRLLKTFRFVCGANVGIARILVCPWVWLVFGNFGPIFRVRHGNVRGSPQEDEIPLLEEIPLAAHTLAHSPNIFVPKQGAWSPPCLCNIVFG